MSLGIGLGAFMEGMQGGMAMRDRFDQRREDRANKKALDQINTETKQAFDTAVSEGKAKPNDFDKFWLDYALPKRRNELLRQGDVSGAKALAEWGQSEDALKGGRLFSSALLKAQTGDTAGAMADVIEAGKLKGYIAHGYEMVGQEDIMDQAGQVVGYRLKVKGPDGKTIEQDVAVGDVPKVIATFANPDAAWQSQQAARADAAKREQEMGDFEKKEQIKSKYDKGKAPDYEKSYADAKKARMENDLSFGDLSPEEQDATIRKDLEAGERYSQARGGAAPQGLGLPQAGPAAAQPGIGGAPASPTPRPQVIVDEVTGQPVQQPAAPAQVAPGAQAPSPGPGPQTSAAPSRDEWIADAARHMQEGGNPEYIAQRLINAGIPPAEWPVEIQRGLKAKQGATVGLGQ
jgi:hypothetical protein